MCVSDEDESRYTGPNAPQILKCVPSEQLTNTTIESPMKDVVISLLDALIVKYPWTGDDGKCCHYICMLGLIFIFILQTHLGKYVISEKK